MEDIKNIYALLLHSNGLKIKDIATSLNLDKYYVAEVLYSFDNSNYWQQDSSSLWYAKDDALQIEEPKQEESVIERLLADKPLKIEKFKEGNNSRSFNYTLRTLQHYRSLSDSEEKKLLCLIRKGDAKAYQALVLACQRLIVNIAMFYNNRGVLIEDLIQEGNIGLIKAINNFNIEGNSRFDEYAKSWILQSVSTAIMNLSTLVRFPLNRWDIHRKINRRIEKFYAENSYMPSSADLTLEDYDFDTIVDVMRYPSNFQMCVQHGINMDELIESPFTADSLVMKESERYKIYNLLHFLSDREKDILESSFGLNKIVEDSLCTIGDRYGLTRERTRQIKENSIEKLQKLTKSPTLCKITEKEDNTKNHKNSIEDERTENVKVKEEVKKEIVKLEIIQTEKENDIVEVKVTPEKILEASENIDYLYPYLTKTHGLSNRKLIYMKLYIFGELSPKEIIEYTDLSIDSVLKELYEATERKEIFYKSGRYSLAYKRQSGVDSKKYYS